MSYSKPIEIRGSVSFETNLDSAEVAAMLSHCLFGNIPFSDDIPGLREEVPAKALTEEVFGLVFILHGISDGRVGTFTLEAGSGMLLSRELSNGSTSIDIGEWMAQLIRAMVGLRVTGFSPK